MSAHTPGPWVVGRYYTSHDEGPLTVKTASGTSRIATLGARDDEANAQLIAAAPDLAAASRDFLRWFRTFIGDAAYNEIRADELDALRAALAKAGL